MPFNPFTWNNTQPSATQLISTGQSTILNNFQFLGSTSGLPGANQGTGFVQLPNGLIIQWAKIAALTASTNAITFVGIGLQNFPTFCFNVFVQGITSTTGKEAIQIDSTVGSFDNTKFSLVTGSNYPNGCFIIATGI